MDFFYQNGTYSAQNLKFILGFHLKLDKISQIDTL